MNPIKLTLKFIAYMAIMSTVGIYIAYQEAREEELKQYYDEVQA